MEKTMQRIWILITFSLFFSSFCSQKEPKTPEEMYNYATKKLNGDFLGIPDYETAIQYYLKVIELFPGTSWAILSKYMLGMAYFKKGDYPVAADTFQEFYTQFPSSPYAEDAKYFEIISFYKLFESYDRDITYPMRVRELCRRFLSENPNSKRYDEVSKIKKEADEMVAQRHLYVAKFYLRRENYLSAIDRLKLIVSDSELLETSAGKTAQKLLLQLNEKIR